MIVYQDTPLFMAESCAYANLIGGCPGKANCKFESMDMMSSHGERVDGARLSLPDDRAGSGAILSFDAIARFAEGGGGQPASGFHLSEV